MFHFIGWIDWDLSRWHLKLVCLIPVTPQASQCDFQGWENHLAVV